MAYRIEYGKDRANEGSGNGGWVRLQVMTAAFLLLFVLLVKQTWPEGTETIQSYLLPGGEGTQTAIERLADQVSEGEPFGQALTVFCREIIENAEAD